MVQVAYARLFYLFYGVTLRPRLVRRAARGASAGGMLGKTPRRLGNRRGVGEE